MLDLADKFLSISNHNLIPCVYEMPYSTQSSRTTIGSKRRRVVTQASAGSMRDAIALTSAPSIYTSVSGVSEQNGNERQYASSKPLKTQMNPYLTLKDLTSLVCPPFKVKVSCYGNNCYSYVSSPNPAAAGTLRNLYSPAGSQYWFESVGLPAYTQGINPTIMEVTDLMAKAKDIRNTANIIDPTVNPPVMPEQLDFQFQYLNGYQRHTFVNSGNTTVHMEVWELHPRHPMLGIKPSGQFIGYNTVGADVLRDYTANQPLANNLKPQYTTASYDSVTDLSVRITPFLDTVNVKYKVSKPVNITIQPGGTFVYTMAFEPFKCTNSEWQTLIDPNTAGGLTSFPHYIPGFTKLLVARAWGELSHSAASEHLYGAVNAGPLSLMHTMVEYHHCRACPYQPTKNTIIDYRLDTSTSATYHEDELEQKNEDFEN